MVVYVDSSALVKRVFSEDCSKELDARLIELERSGSMLVTSVVGRIEVGRALVARAERAGLEWSAAMERDGLAGIRLLPVDEAVAENARVLRPALLRTLDAIHCATAMLARVDSLLTYDACLADAAVRNGLNVESPGSALS